MMMRGKVTLATETLGKGGMEIGRLGCSLKPAFTSSIDANDAKVIALATLLTNFRLPTSFIVFTPFSVPQGRMEHNRFFKAHFL